MKHGLALLAVLVTLGAAQEPARKPEDADRGVLAVLRRDGIMFPFASFRGSYWWAPWPGGLRDVELPINLAAVPDRWWGGWTPASWNAWLPDGTKKPLRAIAPAQFRVHCAPRLGVRTDYRPSEPVPVLPTEPFPKEGLAATNGVRVEPIEIVTASDAERGALAVELLDDFDRVEDLEIGSVANVSQWRHPFDRAERRKQPVRIESWYRTTVEENVVASYVEAVRSYPARPEDDGCGLETLFGGWIHHVDGKLERRKDLGARITYCDRMNATYMLPFGRIRVDDRLYWIAQLSGHESEWYSVTRLSRTRATLVAEYFAGSHESCK
jgi:hypothetical protein